MWLKFIRFEEIYTVNDKVLTWETYAWKQNDRGDEEVKLFSVLTQIVKAA